MTKPATRAAPGGPPPNDVPPSDEPSTAVNIRDTDKGRPTKDKPAKDRPATDTDDQTAILPRQRELPAGEEITAVLPRQRELVERPVEPKPDRWDRAAPPGTARAVGMAPVGGMAGRARALGTVAWVVPTVVVAVVALVRITWPGMAADELELWAFARLPRSAALALLSDMDALDLPYSAAYWAWGHLAGTSDFTLRLPSAIFITAAGALTAALGSRLGGPRTGLLAGLAFAVVPTVSRFGQAAGPTALIIFASVLSTYVLVGLFERPAKRRYLGYLLCVVLLGLANPLALTLLVAHGALVAAVRPRVLTGWLVCLMVGASPAVALLFAVKSRWWPGQKVPNADQLVTGAFGALLLGGLMVGVALLAVSASRPRVVVTACAILPVLTLYGVAQALPIDLPTATLWTMPAWACLAALALGRLPVTAGLSVLFAVALTGTATQLDIRGPDGHGQASRELAATLAAEVAAGDVIIYGPGFDEAQAGRDIVARYVPRLRQPKDILATRPARTNGHLYANECVDVAKCAAGTVRVWLIRLDAAKDPLEGFPAAKDGLLRVNYTAERRWDFRGLTLVLFVLRVDDVDRAPPR